MRTNPHGHRDKDFEHAMNQAALCPRCGQWYPGGLCPNPECPGRAGAPSGALGSRMDVAPAPAGPAPSPAPAAWGYPMPPVPPSPTRGARRGLRTAGLVALAIVVGLSGYAGLTRLTSSGSAAAPKVVKPTYPAAWDARVQPLVDFVELTRGLAFDHPVFVDFLTPAQYSASVHVPAPTQNQRIDAQRQAGMYRAVGLVSGSVDLAASDNQIADQGTLAYYSHLTKRIDVRGTDLTVGLKVTLVHELTHALQDQHFDLTRIERMPSSGAQLAFETLFEGDAVRIQDAYAASLTGADRTAFEAEQNAENASAQSGLASVPPALVTLFGAPYDLGAQLLAVLVHNNGNRAVDDAFRNPPVDEAQAFNPWVYLDNEQPDKVSDPAVAGKSFDTGDYGALSWFVTLSQRIDPHLALQAADAWAGDRYVAYEQNQRVCVRADVDAIPGPAGGALNAAFTAWASVMPGGVASVTQRGTGIEVTTCDPGTSANLQPLPSAQNAMTLPATRTAITLSTLSQGASVAQARCAGTAIVLGFSEADLADPTGAALVTPAGLARIRQLAAPCHNA